MLVRHVAQGAVETVGPAVIPTDERLLAAAAVRQHGAAVAAGIAEGAHPAVAAAHGEERRLGRIARDVGSRARQSRRRTERGRVATQHQLELGGEAALGAIVLDGLAPSIVAQIGTVIVDVVENSLHDGVIVSQWIHRISFPRRTEHRPVAARSASR